VTGGDDHSCTNSWAGDVCLACTCGGLVDSTVSVLTTITGHVVQAGVTRVKKRSPSFVEKLGNAAHPLKETRWRKVGRKVLGNNEKSRK